MHRTAAALNADLVPDDGRCRCCGATQAQRTVWPEVYVGTGQHLRRCGFCAAAYLAPDFSEDALTQFYVHHYRRLFPAEAPWRDRTRFFAWRGDQLIAQRRLRRIAPVLPAAARVFEMGSGFGAFLGAAAAARADLRLSACEPDLAHRDCLLAGAPVQFLAQPHLLADASVEAVVAFHVLEHVPDPRAFLELVARVLTPGGHAWIEVPDAMSDWRSRLYVHPAHLSYFSASLLRRLAQAAGLDVLYCGPYPGGGALADNLWAQLRRPLHPVHAAPLVGADAQELHALDARLDSVKWRTHDRLRRFFKRALIGGVGSGLIGELQRWRGRRRVLEEDRDAL